MIDIRLSDFLDAENRIINHLHKTDIVYSTYFSNLLEADVSFKCENLQKTCSFKIRGAMNKISKLVNQGKCQHIVTASAGNHAQGVAYAGKAYNIPVTIFMPLSTALIKIESAKSYGAEIVLFGKSYDEAYAEAIKYCEENNYTFVHAYNDLDVIAGQGTIALEILNQKPDTDVIIVPAGGGGLLSGIATATKKIKPSTLVYGVQASGSNALALSFKTKKLLTNQKTDTIADGIAVGNPGDKCFELINQYVDDIFEVDDKKITMSLVMMMERTKLICEPSSATTLAVLLNNKEFFKGKKVVCVLSGGNVDLSKIHKYVEMGLIESNRWVKLMIKATKNSDTLENIFHIINTKHNATIVEFETENFRKDIGLNESVFSLTIEVRNSEHRDEVIEDLNQFYSVEIV